jgi:hypothetical protein
VHCDEKRERTKPHGLWQAVGEIDNLEMLGAPTSRLQAYLDASTAMQPMLGSNPETEALAAHRRTILLSKFLRGDALFKSSVAHRHAGPPIFYRLQRVFN